MLVYLDVGPHMSIYWDFIFGNLNTYDSWPLFFDVHLCWKHVVNVYSKHQKDRIDSSDVFLLIMNSKAMRNTSAQL